MSSSPTQEDSSCRRVLVPGASGTSIAGKCCESRSPLCGCTMINELWTSSSVCKFLIPLATRQHGCCQLVNPSCLAGVNVADQHKQLALLAYHEVQRLDAARSHVLTLSARRCLYTWQQTILRQGGPRASLQCEICKHSYSIVPSATWLSPMDRAHHKALAAAGCQSMQDLVVRYVSMLDCVTD